MHIGDTRWWACLAALADLVLPQQCAGCGRAGPAWCRGCAQGSLALMRERTHRRVTGQGRPDGFPPTWAATSYTGAIANVIVAYKDGARRDLRPLLAGWLVRALAEAVAATAATGAGAHHGRPAPVLVVPVPSSRANRRRRGDDPVADLAAAGSRLLAARLAGVASLRWAPVLRTVSGTRDQSGLGRAGRLTNASGSIRVRGDSGVIAGSRCVLVDDVVTSGATITACAGRLATAGATSIAAAVVAETVAPGHHTELGQLTSR